MFFRTKSCPSNELKHRAATLLRLDAMNYTTPQDFFDRNFYLFCTIERKEYSPRGDDSLLKSNIDQIVRDLAAISQEQWGQIKIKQVLEELATSLLRTWKTDRKGCRNALSLFLRWALTGGRSGLAVIPTMALLGKDESIRRIEDAAAAFSGISDRADG